MTQSLLVSIHEACERAGIGRSFLYERMADGSIRSVRAGRRRLVVVESLNQWVASLPESPLKSNVKGN